MKTRGKLRGMRWALAIGILALTVLVAAAILEYDTGQSVAATAGKKGNRLSLATELCAAELVARGQDVKNLKRVAWEAQVGGAEFVDLRLVLGASKQLIVQCRVSMGKAPRVEALQIEDTTSAAETLDWLPGSPVGGPAGTKARLPSPSQISALRSSPPAVTRCHRRPNPARRD